MHTIWCVLIVISMEIEMMINFLIGIIGHCTDQRNLLYFRKPELYRKTSLKPINVNFKNKQTKVSSLSLTSWHSLSMHFHVLVQWPKCKSFLEPITRLCALHRTLLPFLRFLEPGKNNTTELGSYLTCLLLFLEDKKKING